MTTKWRLNRRGWAIAFAITCASVAVLWLGGAVPFLRPVAAGLVGLSVAIGLILAMAARSREFSRYTLTPPPDPDGDESDDQARP